jgi:hypothetical protein
VLDFWKSLGTSLVNEKTLSMPKSHFQPVMPVSESAICHDLWMANSDPQSEVALINGVILDVGALESRIDAALGRLSVSQDHDGRMRHKALVVFRESLLAAATRLRQDGLHPGQQGSLW